MKLIVLMSTYNGEQYIRQQLDSLLKQDLRPDKIIIRDDGSKDDTVNLLEEYSSEHSFISYYCGVNKGPGKSFWELICNCEDADYYALCDQDDVWFADKLSTAISTLSTEDNSIPLLYCSRYTLTDTDLNPNNSEVSSLYDFSDFQHSLIYHTSPGCTFVFNHAARNILKMYDPDSQYFVIHDAIIHKVVTMFGKMILDKSSHMYYRQHNNNQIGMTADKFKTLAGRIRRFVDGSIRNYRSNTAKSLLSVYGGLITDDKRELLNIVANYAENSDLKRAFLENDGFKSHTINDLFLKILVLVNYI